MKFDLTHAILSLRPASSWSMREDNYATLDWLDPTTDKPTEAELQLEVARLQAEWDAKEYQRLRRAEYPDFRDYLDGVVKNDTAQIEAYVAACLAVKAKYPKPE